MLYKLSPLVLLATAAKAHYFLQSPPSIGFDDTTLTTSPCGGFSASDRSGGVTDWPVSGYPFSVITTHLDVVWTFKAALITNGAVGAFQDVYPNVHQTGISEFCLPLLPGVQEWIGRDVVFQVVQKAPDGDLHQCAAIRYVSGSPAAPGDCSNSTNVRATTVPGTGPKPPVTLDPTTSTTSAAPTTSSPSTTSSRAVTTSTPSTEPEPTEEPTTAEETTTAAETTSPDPTSEPTTTATTETTQEPTEHTHSSTSGSHHNEPTDTPTYTPPTPTLSSSTSVTYNATTILPPPPSYTGGASNTKALSVSFIVIAITGALMAF